MKLLTPKGMRDFSPEEKILREEIIKNLKETFELYGFVPLETPIVERYGILSAKFAAGEESDALKETFKLKDQGNRKLGLRFDLTVPLARYVASNSGIKMPFKRYEIGPVFRDGPIKLGRYRQFWQCDADVVGSRSMRADAELISLALDCFKALNLDAYLEVNNRKLLKGIIEFVGINKSRSDSVIVSIDKLSKFEKKEVVKELKLKGIKQDQIEKLLSFFSIKGTNKKKLDFLNKNIKDELAQEGLRELEEIFSYVSSKDVVFNVSLARGLGYYTGPVFEGYLKKNKIKSSICGGGRYDKMIGSLLGNNNKYPITGISFGLDVISEAFKFENKKNKKTNTRIYLIPIKTEKECLKVLKKLRKSNINSDMDMNQRSLSKNLEYANKMGIPYVLIIGKKEVKAKRYTLRDMKSGRERFINFEVVVKMVNK